MAHDPLKRVQVLIAAKLRAETWFDNFPIFTVRSKTIEQDVTNALMGLTKRNGKTGLAIQVRMPMLFRGGSVPSGKASEIVTLVRVQEIPDINFAPSGTQVSSEDVALRVQDTLQAFNLDGGPHVLGADSRVPLAPSLEFEPRLTYDVPFVQAMTRTALTLVAPVTFTVAANVTLACATSGASIYYSTDADIFPSAAAGATLYSSPFAAPASGTTIYAAAYKSGLAGSLVTQREIA